MYSLPTNNPEPHSPVSTQYPLRPASRVSPFRINVLKSVRTHKTTCFLVALLVLGVGLAVVARHKATWVSDSYIYVSPTPINTLVADRELDRPYESYVQETVHAIDRYDILADAIRKMPPGLWQLPGESEHSAVQRLQKALDISRVGTTYQVRIAIEGARPEHLADIVNIVTGTYLERARKEQFYGADERLNQLKDEQSRIEKERDSLLKEQGGITKGLGIASFNKGSNLIDSENSQVSGELAKAHEQRIQAEAQLAALNSGDASADNSVLNAAADEAIASDPGLAALKSNLSGKRALLLDKLAGETEVNPDRKTTESQLAQIDKALNDMQSDLRHKAANRLEQKYRSQLNSSSIIESKLQGDLVHGTNQASVAAPKIQRAEEIQSDLDRLQTRYAAVDERISNLELESSSPGSVHLFSPALTPLAPESSKIQLFLLILFPFSIVMGVVSAIAMDLLDQNIYTASDVEGVLGFAPLGMLFDDREVTQIVFDECALRLAAGVDHAARISGARTFVITGVNSGSGTTSIIENLGSMLAKLGRKTLVIDPSGNTEPVAFVTFGTDLEKLPVNLGDTPAISTGSSTELQQLHASTQSLPSRIGPMNGFVLESFQHISAGYDIVLIDAAPLLISAETEYLARMADVTILVAEAGKTRKAWLTRAARLLERLGVAGAAAVVNKVHPARAEEALKHDLREFELRTDRVNLQEWWKPGSKTPRPASVTPFDKDKSSSDEEDIIYARKL
jgi:polysaccharide biosynthesis transport protein